MRAQRANQGPDRSSLPDRRNRTLSTAHWESTALAEAASVLERDRLSCGCRSVAHSGRAKKSSTGQRPRISVVLLRQRTYPALPQPACAARLRHGPAATVLGIAGIVADSLDRISSTIVAGSSA